MAKMWELKQSVEGVLDLYIYGDVKSDSYDWWDGHVKSTTSAEHFRGELAKYPNISEIHVYINSYGGSVFEGTAIYNQLRRHSAKKVVHIDGFACSIASVIAMAGDEIIMPRNTMMMIHNMSMGVFGTSAELRKAADDLDTINAAGRQAYLARAGDRLTEDALVSMMDAETWLTAEQCIEYGFADRYADTDADLTKAKEILQQVNLNLEQRIHVNRGLAAQLREMATPPQPSPKPENPILKMFN